MEKPRSDIWPVSTEQELMLSKESKVSQLAQYKIGQNLNLDILLCEDRALYLEIQDLIHHLA